MMGDFKFIMYFQIFIYSLFVLIHKIYAEEAFGNIENDNVFVITPKPAESASNKLCEVPHEFPTFIRVMQARKEGPGLFIRQMESLTLCAETCRSNRDAVENLFFDCHGFGVIGNGLEKKCEFYDESADEIPLHIMTSMESKATYFEKQCLAIPSHCTNGAFSYELQKDRVLLIQPLESIIVDDRKRCLNFCLSNPACHSVNFNQHNGTCQVFDKTCRSVAGGLVAFAGIDYYENTCAQEINRCLPGQRVDFFITKNAEISGLDVSLGVISLRNCMRECIDSTIMFCRSFEYDRLTEECFLVEESSEMSEPSRSADLYEPICLNRAVDTPCSGDYVFERIPGVNLIAEGFIKHMAGSKVDYCMDDCLIEDSCISIVYDKEAKTCKLYAANRNSPLSKSASDFTTDLYELACDRSAVFRDSITERSTSTTQRRETKAILLPRELEDPCGTKLIEVGRTLRLEYRNLHHVNVKSQMQCKDLCMTAKVNCATFAYDENSRDCLLSTTVVDRNQEYNMVTQPRAGFNLYAYMGYRTGATCLPQSLNTLAIKNDFFTTVPYTEQTNPTIFTEILQTTPFTKVSTLSTAQRTEPSDVGQADNAFNFDSNWFDITGQKTNETMNNEEFDSGSTPFNENNFIFGPATTLPIPTTVASTRNLLPQTLPRHLPTVLHVITTTPSANGFDISDRFNGRKKFFDSQASKDAEATKEEHERIAEKSQINQPKKDETPRRLTETSNIRKINISNVELTAICLDHGINVTFMTKNQFYTGAVYAAERYSQCRVLIENRNEFSIFINRPSENNLCNALEVVSLIEDYYFIKSESLQDNMMTVVLVMSNDLVLPFDVTTKDDLFYQITCDYKDEPEMTLIHSGVVVGGPEPKSVVSTLRHQDQPTKVALRILKDDHPVSNVFMGEKLTALVESDVNASRILVTECNATRVGGREPRPSSVQLIINGCSVMPQIISNMFDGNKGTEATLTAFRIDGSDQIDIACNETCEDILKRHRRGVSLSSPSPVDILSSETPIEDMVTVDQRLRVLVDNDNNNDSAASTEAGKLAGCLDPLYLIIVLGLLLLSIIALGLSFFANRCKRRRSNDM